MTFGELQDEALLLVIDTPTSVQSLMPKFVQRAHRKIQEKHDFEIMQATLNATTVIGQRLLIATPADWKRVRAKPYYVENLGGIRDMVWSNTQGDALASWGANTDLSRGAPRILTRDSTQISVYPIPDGRSDYSDGEYRVAVPYWKYLPTLTAAGDNDWFTDVGDITIIYTAVADAFFADHDAENALLWTQRATKELKELIQLDKGQAISTTESLVYHTGALMPHTQE